jgi:hypothetical protein
VTELAAGLGAPRTLAMFAFVVAACAAALYVLRENRAGPRIAAAILGLLLTAAAIVLANSGWISLVVIGWVVSIRSTDDRVVAGGVALLILGFGLVAVT